MDRRKFLKAAPQSALALAAAGTLAAPALAQGKRQLKMVTAWPPNYPGLGTSANRFAQRVADLTDGAVTIKVFAANELVGAFETFDAVSNGAADMYHAADYYWQGKSPAYNFFTAVPFGLNANEHSAWIHHGGGQKLWDELGARFKIKPLQACNTGVQMGGWFNKEITKLDDLKGLKMRIPGLGGEVMRRLGATPLTLAGGEIFEALGKRTIDATEWVGPWNDLAFGFHRAAKFYYWPGWHEPGSALAVGLNLGVWTSLTKQQRAAFETAAMAETSFSLAEFNHQNAIALKTLIDKHKVQLKRFPNDVLQALARASGQVLKEAAAKDAFTKRVYDSFMAARKGALMWGDISEEGYAAARRLPYPFE
jgi:TRAP-type mannitol/chloroaromatic compound transport system substrate-binding protein